MESANARPEATFTYGAVSLSVWRKDTEKGVFLVPGKAQRRYRNSEGDWAFTEHVDARDLMDLSLAASDAYRFIQNWKNDPRRREAAAAA